MKNLLYLLALAVSLIAGLCFVAGAPAIGLVPRELGNFAGIAAGAVSVVLWVAYYMQRKSTNPLASK